MKIVYIKEIFDDVDCRIKYEVTVWCDDSPNLKLGACEIKQ